ncbi:hypothetical protein [Paenibacillus sp. S150]|uniref:hypothetical protein n=1 Tax=Paenibacillus sp. S150 TaxID=2749826 RepID=UPI001C55DBB6|nr:hypothetical protein [Paenibacillus sp. S150]MBW4080999.1 hypothetical protein [Paenibacillus sp. S150]
MTVITGKVQALLQDSEAVKALATVDQQGWPHVIMDHSLTANDKGQLIYLELIETSQTNLNLVNSIWFKRKVAVRLSRGEEAYLIKGYPVYSIICGPVFEHYYTLARKIHPDFDLSTVWVIEPDEIIEDTYVARKSKERAEHPLVMHLDRLAK